MRGQNDLLRENQELRLKLQDALRERDEARDQLTKGKVESRGGHVVEHVAGKKVDHGHKPG